MQPINQMAFMIGLADIHRHAQRLRLILKLTGNIVERVRPINIRFPRAEQV